MTLSKMQSKSIICSLIVVFLSAMTKNKVVEAVKDQKQGTRARTTKNLKDLDYRIYPRRSQEEAAVIEWGHSAIISALDASVAHFGPQTSQAALLEVETKPVLAAPVNGVWDDNNTVNEEGVEEEASSERKLKQNIRPLDNAHEVHGNVVVMTNTGGLSGFEMAKIAKASGAAALMVVNVDEERPDDIYRLTKEEDEEHDKIDIPVVMISLNSANVLTTATVTPEMKQEEIINHGMPERIRLYAGGDRPFFEDVEAAEPTIYIIHNLLSTKECESLINQAKTLVSPITSNDSLQFTQDYKKFTNVQRVMLWDGMLKNPERKSIEERIEQVTGFPAAHYSDFIVDRLEKGSYYQPHYDTIDGSIVPIATITIFLSKAKEGGEIVYPSASGDPVKIKSQRGLAVIHHNTDEQNQFEVNSLHALLPVTSDDVEEFYIARKFILPNTVSNSRRIALPIIASPFGGKLPKPVISLHEFMIETFGQENGDIYFDKFFIFLPALIALLLAQFVANFVRKKLNEASESTSANHSKKKKMSSKKKD